MKYFLTGATGSIGSELYKTLTKTGHVTGFSRNKPHWWCDKDRFVSFDFSTGKIDHCLDYVDAETTIIHTLNLTHQNTNVDLSNTIKLYEYASRCGAKSFIYVSSIRIYSGLFGQVDEETAPAPHHSDVYGHAKLRAEEVLIQLSASTNTPVCICRIGSVFSAATPRKIPIQLRKFSRWLDKGMNTHLISACNVAQAICYVATQPSRNAIEIYNVTQEIDGQNDYMRLGDLLHGVQKSFTEYKTCISANWLRNLYRRFRGTSIAMPYITVKESKLSNAGFRYQDDLLVSLRESRAAIDKESFEA